MRKFTQVHKIEILVVDHDHMGIDAVIEAIETQNYPNDCIRPRVKYSNTAEVEWSDDHPLNGVDHDQAYKELFGDDGYN